MLPGARAADSIVHVTRGARSAPAPAAMSLRIDDTAGGGKRRAAADTGIHGADGGMAAAARIAAAAGLVHAAGGASGTHLTGRAGTHTDAEQTQAMARAEWLLQSRSRP